MANTNDWWKSGATPVEQPSNNQAEGWWKAGAKEVIPDPPSRSVLAAVNDTAIELANAAAGGVSSAANFIKPGNAVSGFIDKNIVKTGEEKQSDAVKAEKKRYADEMAAAKGIGDEVGATLGYVARNPVLAAAQAAGSFAGPGAAIKGFGAAAKALGAGAKAVTNAGRAGGVVASGAMAGGDAAGAAHELAKNAGASEEQAVAAGRQASMIPGAIGAVTGAFGAEKLLAGAKGFGGSTAARALKTGASEAVQEGVEEGVTQYEGQRAAMPYDPSIDPTKGVAGAATMGAVLGGATGGGVSLLTPAHGSQPEISGGMRDGADAFASGAPRTPPDSIKSVVAKAQWVRGWDAAANAQSAAAGATGAAVNPSAQAWTTSPGATENVEPSTAPASPANAPNLDYETLPGAAPQSFGNEVDFKRDFETPQWDTQLGAGMDGQPAPAGNAAPKAPNWELTPSQAMGLDAKAGGLTAAAALAVDSGASPVVQPQAAPVAEQTPVLQQAAPQVPAGVDPETGEVSLQAQMDEIKGRIAFMQQQGAAQGWNKDMVTQRNALQSQLTKLEVQSAKENKQGASTTRAPAPVKLTGITQILAKQIPDMSAGELEQAIAHYGPNHKRTKKLEKALQALAQKPLVAIDNGADDGTQTPQTQQIIPQPAQAGAAQASAPAVQGVSANASPAQYDGAQAGAPTAAKSQAPSTQAAPAKQVNAAEAIAKEGNAQREQERQRLLDASERWTRMTTVERQAVTATAPGLNAIARKNLHTRAWADIGEKVRGQLLDSLVEPLAQSSNLKNELGEGAGAYSDKLEFRIKDANYKLMQANSLSPLQRELSGNDLGSMAAEVSRLESRREEAKALDEADRRESADRSMLKAARQELDASSLTQEQRADTVQRAGSTGNAVDASLNIFEAVDQGNPVAQKASLKQASQPVGDEKPFAAETGTLGIPRADMPQVPAANHGGLVKHLNAQGIAHETKTVDAAELKPTQTEYSPSKVEAAKSAGGDRAVIVSNDGHIIDGHHQAVAAAEEGKPVKAIVLDAPVEKALEAVKASPSAQSQGEAESESAILAGAEFPMAEAINSYSGISHSGSQRAKQDDAAFEKFMASAQAAADKLLETDGQREALVMAAEQLRADYLVQYRALMNVRAGTYSGFVAGRGNLNSKQANSRNNALDKAMERFDGWVGDNADRLSKAVLAARAPEQVKADQDKVKAAAEEKAAKKASGLKAQLLKFLSFKSGENLPYGKNVIITKVSYDRDGYPSSLIFKMADGSPVTNDKLELVPTLKDKDETLEQAKARIRALVDEVRAENPELNKGIGAIRAAAAGKADKPKSIPAKVREAMAARADYFTPGNIVHGYGNTFDRVIAYNPPDDQGRWSVTVQEVKKQGDTWVDAPNERERTHTTQPTARDLKAGPVQRVASEAVEGASFRREAADTATGADFDVASFLQIMNEGQPASAAASGAPAMNVRPSFSPAARAEAVRAVTGTADAIRQAWANGPEVIVAFDMQDPAVPDSARRADLKQRSGGARGAPEGFYYQGKVYLMASKLKTPNDAARVLFHEALGHHGLRGLFGKELGQILNQVAAMREVEVDAKIEEYGLRRVNRLDRRTAAEEVLAEMAQNTPQIGFVRRAVAAVRTWLRTHVPGFKSLALTDAELIRNYILPARAWVERGAAVARSDGGVSFSRDSRDVPQTDVEKARVLQGAPVAEVDTAIAPMGAPAIRSWAADLFEQQGGLAHNPVLGDVTLDGRSVRSSLAHGRPNAHKVAAFAAVKDVLEKGTVVLSARHGRDGDSFYVSAPVKVGGATNIVTVLVKRDPNDQRMYLHSVATKEYLLNRRVSRTDTTSGVERSGSNDSGDTSTLAKQRDVGKASTEEVADELHRLLTLDTKSPPQPGAGGSVRSINEKTPAAQWVDASAKADGQDLTSIRSTGDSNSLSEGLRQSDADEPMFSRSRFMDLKDSALDQLSQTFTHAGKVSLWDKTVGTMRNLAERAPAFKPVYEAASQNIDDVSMLANDAADMAPRILPRVESLRDIFGKARQKPVAAADNKAVARPLFEGTLIWARDENGKPALVDDLQKRYANLSVHNKAAMLLKHGKIDSGVLAMWQGLPVAQFEKLINSRFESKMLKAGIVWSDSELQSQFGANANQISLYREARAAIDRSIDMTARTDMLRVVGEKYEPMRDAVLAQPSVEAAAQLLLDTLEQDAKADPDSRERLAGYMQLISARLDQAVDLQKAGYAPLSRFGNYKVYVKDAKTGESLYFGMYESKRESNLAKMQMATLFPGAVITQGTMSEQEYKLFAGVTPETLEQFGEMLGLKSEGNEAQDKAFQEFLKLTKNNHSAMKRLIHRKGVSGFSEDVGRVVASFVYSNARAGAMGLNAGKMDKAIGEIPQDQGELRDLAIGLRSYIRDPQEEGQAVRGMLFAQYLGGSLASAFVNMTQPFQITMPWLSQYGGMGKASKQMARAVNDMRRSWMDKGFSYEPDLAKALKAAEDDGTVSPQEIHALMAQARGAGMLRSGDGTKAGNLRANVGNKWEQGKVLWGQPFALAEQFNRRSTFIAAYRTAKAQGMADPAGFARKAVLETQFVYSKANKPKWARGAVGGTLFTFKTYSVSYLELMNRMWTQGGPEGKRAVGWALAMLLLMSGAGGVPFMEDAEDLIDGVGQLAGYNVSSKQWRKEFLAGAVGKELADFMEQGISGLPGAPVDVSGRLGMGNLIPGTGLFLNKPNRERDLMEIVGPAGDLVSRGFTGARKLLGGDVAGAALEVSPTAVRNLAKGGDMAATGMYRDTKGYKVIDTTLAEAAAKAIGFQPKSVAEVQEANSFMQRSKSFYTQTSSDIKAQWADALFRKDEAAVQRVRERLADWNRDNPDQPIVVRMPDVWKRVREMGKDRSDRIADTAPKALRAQMRAIASQAQ